MGTKCPARPPAGEHRQGLLFSVRTRIFHSSPPFPHTWPFPSPRLRSAVCTACVACCARMNAYKILKLFLRQFIDRKSVV